MRTIETNLYQFHELNDEAKENARAWYRHIGDYHWSDESMQSIQAFCDHFRVHLKTWSVAPYSRPDYNCEFFNSHFRGMKLRDFKRDNMPTGYYLDCVLWETFCDKFKATGCANKAFDDALYAGFIAWRDDMESQLSDEYIDDFLIANEYEFTEEGARA